MAIFLTIVTTLFPLMMIIFGYWMFRYPPKKIRWWFGYRTAASMRSEASWLLPIDMLAAIG